MCDMYISKICYLLKEKIEPIQHSTKDKIEFDKLDLWWICKIPNSISIEHRCCNKGFIMFLLIMKRNNIPYDISNNIMEYFNKPSIK